MASHKSYAMDSFHNCSSDDSVSSNGLTKKKLPPDKSFLAAGHHMMQIFIWFLVLSFCSGDSIQISVTEDHLRVPEDSFYTFAESEQYMFFPVIWSSYAADIQFTNLAVRGEPNLNDVQRKIFPDDHFCLIYPAVQALLINDWTTKLDLSNPPSRSQLTQMIVPDTDVQRFQKSSQKSHFYYFYSINIPFIYNNTFC